MAAVLQSYKDGDIEPGQNMYYPPVIALVVSLALVLVLYALAAPSDSSANSSNRPSTAWSAFLTFFVILFLASWAGGLWIRPVGPVVGGISWVPFVFVGVIVAMLFAAARPERYRTFGPHGAHGDREDPLSAAGIALSVFFWFLVITLLIAIGIAYME